MGGQTFASTSNPINCPRMPPDVYNKIASKAQSDLETLFNRVTIPREAPRKLDYGDIDLLVANQKTNCESLPRTPGKSRQNVWVTVGQLLGSIYHKHSGSTHHYAIRHPDIPDAYVQVDVELSPGQGTPDCDELFEWMRFMKSDSDLLQIVGICHRPLGLTCNDRGLHVRIEQIEEYDKKKSLLFLTRNPDEVMKFLGFDAAKYWLGFDTEEELFRWVSEGRFFSPDVFNRRVEKANDRARQIKRPMYRRFIEDYMPSYTSPGMLDWTREKVLDEVSNTFDKREEYSKAMAEHYTREADRLLWREIQESLPLEDVALGMAIRGLKRWVNFADGAPYIASEPTTETSLQPMWASTICSDENRKASLLAWVQDHWAEVDALEKARMAAANGG